jgi:predicted DNA-binding antitoxin AbrB/MazE fold protein
MTTQVRAVYENGVFRPLEPVALEDHQEVTLSVESKAEDNLADLAVLFFGDQGVNIEPHPPVSVRQGPNFGK